MESPCSPAERDFRYAPPPMNRDLRFASTSWMQGMFCRAAVFRATVRNLAGFFIRSLT